MPSSCVRSRVKTSGLHCEGGTLPARWLSRTSRTRAVFLSPFWHSAARTTQPPSPNGFPAALSGTCGRTQPRRTYFAAKASCNFNVRYVTFEELAAAVRNKLALEAPDAAVDGAGGHGTPLIEGEFIEQFPEQPASPQEAPSEPESPPAAMPLLRAAKDVDLDACIRASAAGAPDHKTSGRQLREDAPPWFVANHVRPVTQANMEARLLHKDNTTLRRGTGKRRKPPQKVP
jgi:hypothetical protein